jgi:hypothetical protein
MRFHAADIANFVAWLVLLFLIAIAFVVVIILGPFGLVLLGLAVLFVCTAVSLDDANPTWSVEVFRARQLDSTSPEQKAAHAEDRKRLLGSLRFYRLCGLTLLIVGVAGFVWQRLR